MFILTQDEYDHLKKNYGGICLCCRETHILCHTDDYCGECKKNAVRPLVELEEDGLLTVVPD